MLICKPGCRWRIGSQPSVHSGQKSGTKTFIQCWLTFSQTKRPWSVKVCHIFYTLLKVWVFLCTAALQRICRQPHFHTGLYEVTIYSRNSDWAAISINGVKPVKALICDIGFYLLAFSIIHHIQFLAWKRLIGECVVLNIRLPLKLRFNRHYSLSTLISLQMPNIKFKRAKLIFLFIFIWLKSKAKTSYFLSEL